MELYILNIEEGIETSEYERLIDLVAPEKKEKIGRFHFENDRKRALYGNVLIRFLISRRLHINNKDIVFETNSYGKPYIADNRELYFNLSHSGKWIFCGLAEKEIGVDIERRAEGRQDIAKRFFTDSEYQYLMSISDDKQKQMFYDFWSLKESYIKYKGKGLSIPLNTFQFDFEGETILLRGVKEPTPFVRRYTFDPEYSMAVCSMEEPANYINRMPLKMLTSWEG